MPNGVRVEQSRTLPVSPEQAFRGIIEMDVPTMFRRRYGPIPPILNVSGRDAGDWRGTAGQTRVLELGPWGSIRETVVSVDQPHAWVYRITDFKGPLAALLDRIEAEFRFRPAGTGTRITCGATTCFRGRGWPPRHCRRSLGSGEVTRVRCSRSCRAGWSDDRTVRANDKRVIREVVKAVN
ncbi:SRPBCC family protein [Mycobacterium sp. 23]|uniref:SRPBCC family protein n=1 Tax=Mycobacterium sp. 23 TaxID=3400424 RepID=UPI003AB0599F